MPRCQGGASISTAATQNAPNPSGKMHQSWSCHVLQFDKLAAVCTFHEPAGFLEAKAGRLPPTPGLSLPSPPHLLMLEAGAFHRLLNPPAKAPRGSHQLLASPVWEVGLLHITISSSQFWHTVLDECQH